MKKFSKINWKKRNLIFLFVLALVVLVGLFYFLLFSKKYTDTIKTRYGKVKGTIEKSRGGREYFSFMGIPYAKPPKRFEPPKQLTEKIEGVYDATYERNKCLQIEFFVVNMVFGSEDCLYLNVYTPKLPDKTNNTLLPVIVYIHGGLWNMGWPFYPTYFMDEDIIVVTIQYRVGAFGFLNTGDGLVRGNMGLKDQVLALKYVNKNIKFFGGDPSRVTIYGESAGGASVQYHMLSPRSAGLFSRAIHSSGSAIHHWAVQKNGQEQAEEFSRNCDCPTNNGTEKMVQCLKEKEGKELLKCNPDILKFVKTRNSIFAPNIEVLKDDKAFLTQEPEILLKEGKINKVDAVLAGCNSNEGLLLTPVLAKNEEERNKVDDWDSWAPQVFVYSPSLVNISETLFVQYFGSDLKRKLDLSSTETEDFQGLTNLFSDRYFKVALGKSALLEGKLVPTQVYYYDHKGGFSTADFTGYSQSKLYWGVDMALDFLGRWFKENIFRMEIQHLGASHGDEIALLFSGIHLQLFFSNSRDLKMSKDLVKLWVDFAYGKSPLQFRGIEFPLVENEKIQPVIINDDPQVISEPYQETRIFFESLNIPKY